MAQSCHALMEFREQHPEVCLEWMRDSNYIVICESDNLEVLVDKPVKKSYFLEPDLDNRMTAVVLEPIEESRKICAGFRLAK